MMSRKGGGGSLGVELEEKGVGFWEEGGREASAGGRMKWEF